MLAAGLVAAEEKDSLSSRTFTTAEVGFNLDYGNDQMAEHTIDERITDRLGLFEAPDSGSPPVTILSSTSRMKTATGVSKSLLRSNFDSKG